jgi:SRSO17 transposase
VIPLLKAAGGDGMGVAEWTGTLVDWRAELEKLKRAIAPALGRAETRRSAAMFLDGLFSAAARKTGWMLAEQAGLDRPYRLQSLLGRSSWSADHLRDLVRRYVGEALGDPGGVLVVDETGFVKKGRQSVGVGRQYSGTAGRIENCQVGVFVAYASRWGHALVDRQLYLPKDWANDGQRRQTASVPDDIAFKSKPALAREMVERALDAGLSCAWVLADSLYGSDSQLRRMLEDRGQPYVLAVRSNHTLRFLEDWTLVQTDPATLAAALGDDAWSSLAAGEGSKGPRLYDWARVPLGWSRGEGFERWLLLRRSRHDPHALAFYFAYAPEGASLAELAGAAGLRWTIEECFLRAKDDLGLDHCEARSWHGWHRHISLVMAAAAYLARLSADQRRLAFGKRDKRSPAAAAA